MMTSFDALGNVTNDAFTRVAYDNTAHLDSSVDKSVSLSLLQLPKQKIAYIDAIVDNTAFGQEDLTVSRRLYDLGFLPNTAIKIVAKGLFGRPPFAVQLAGGAQFSLRRDELAKIQCRLV